MTDRQTVRARRFQEAAEAAWPSRPVIATISPYDAIDGLPCLLWEVELSDSCERARRHLPAAADPSPEAVVRDLRTAIGMAHHLAVPHWRA